MVCDLGHCNNTVQWGWIYMLDNYKRKCVLSTEGSNKNVPFQKEYIMSNLNSKH